MRAGPKRTKDFQFKPGLVGEALQPSGETAYRDFCKTRRVTHLSWVTGTWSGGNRKCVCLLSTHPFQAQLFVFSLFLLPICSQCTPLVRKMGKKYIRPNAHRDICRGSPIKNVLLGRSILRIQHANTRLAAWKGVVPFLYT